MAKKHWVAICIVCLLLIGNSVVCKAKEVIELFSSEITVIEDGSIVVTELIRANCEGKKIRHGIYRDIPIIYNKGFGLKLRSNFKILEVKIDGKPSSYHTKFNHPNLRIYIGSKSKYVSRGVHDFLITYKMEGMLSFFEDFDELYWNVTGSDWVFPIEKARVIIRLPKPVSFLKSATYTGYPGSKSSMARPFLMERGQIGFETSKRLYPGQGFTVAVAWPKGVVKEPTQVERIFKLFSDNLFLIFGVFLLFIAFLYYFYAWSKVGKDPELGPIMPRFNPPSNISPQASRFIRKMGWDDKILAVALVNLAVKGAIIFRERGSNLIIEKQDGTVKEPLTRGEEKILNMLVGAFKVLELDKKSAKKITSAVEGLKDVLKKEYEKIYFLTNRKYLAPGIILSIVSIALLGLNGIDKVAGLFITVWLTIWCNVSGFMLMKGIASAKARSFGMLIFAIPFNLFTIVGCVFYSLFIGVTELIFFALALIMNIAFYYFMKAPTMKGLEVLRELEGFRMFLKTAEANRLEALTPVDRLPELFERYLPWAMALDVENTWAKKFEELLREKGQDYSYSPSWYAGPRFYSYSGISSAVTSGLSSAIASATAPSSSGSGGGGFSGGGGGGGGGGGW